MEVSEPFTKIVPSLTNNIPINPPSLSGIVQDNQLSSFLLYLPASYKEKTWQNRPKKPDFDPRNYGFPKLTPLIESCKSHFTIEKRNSGNSRIKHVYVKRNS